MLKSLQNLDKDSTPPLVFKLLFKEVTSTYKKDRWSLIYTDGSKTNAHVGFAVVDENGYTLKRGLLPQHATVFEAEAVAIIEALKLCKNSATKQIICTDSRSVLDATLNQKNKNFSIIIIQQLLIQLKRKVKLLWLPSHIGIEGNETADKVAKTVYLHPTQTFLPQSKNFISREALDRISYSLHNQWCRYNHLYQTINPNKTPIDLPPSTAWHKNKCFIRLRLTHTKLTHQYLLSKNPQPRCPFCNNNSALTILHLLSECQALRNLRRKICKTENIINLLKTPSVNNINVIFDFLQAINIHKDI